MIRFIGQLPKKCVVAFSGGVDSVVAVDFLLKGKREVTLAFFHHGTKDSDTAAKSVVEFSRERGLPLALGNITTQRPAYESQEEFWRNQRYAFLNQFNDPVVTGHHLDDAVETWIFTSLHGEPKLIPYKRGRVIRPFLLTPKSEIKRWAISNNLKWSEDASNEDTAYMRNLIRHRIVPEALKVNPGLRTLIRKRYLALGTSAGLINS